MQLKTVSRASNTEILCRLIQPKCEPDNDILSALRCDRPQSLVSKGVSLTPTLSCYGIMVRPPFEDFLPPDGKVKNKQVMEQGLNALKLADEAGVNIC